MAARCFIIPPANVLPATLTPIRSCGSLSSALLLANTIRRLLTNSLIANGEGMHENISEDILVYFLASFAIHLSYVLMRSVYRLNFIKLLHPSWFVFRLCAPIAGLGFTFRIIAFGLNALAIHLIQLTMALTKRTYNVRCSSVLVQNTSSNVLEQANATVALLVHYLQAIRLSSADPPSWQRWPWWTARPVAVVRVWICVCTATSVDVQFCRSLDMPCASLVFKVY